MRSIAALSLCLGLTAALAACSQGGGNSTGGGSGAPTSGEMSLGNPAAKVQVVEYASLGCPICAQWTNTNWDTFKTKFIDSGKIHYTLREYVLTGDGPVATAGFLLAHCAGKDKYFQVVESVFRQEAPLLETDRNTEKRDALVKVAQSAGLTEQQFDACVSNEQAILKLNDQAQKYATDDKINSTPTFVINGKPIVTGDEAEIEKGIADAQAAAK
jgi:protein-disulfide isomerase